MNNTKPSTADKVPHTPLSQAIRNALDAFDSAKIRSSAVEPLAAEYWKLREREKAAPQLLAALQSVADDYDNTGCEDCGVISAETLAGVTAAIASAKGQA